MGTQFLPIRNGSLLNCEEDILNQNGMIIAKIFISVSSLTVTYKRQWMKLSEYKLRQRNEMGFQLIDGYFRFSILVDGAEI